MKPGYKQTEVGVIPVDWEVPELGSIASFSSGSGISVAALHGQSSSFPVPVFGGNGIAGYTRTALVREKTIVIGRVGQKCGEVYVTDGPAWVSDNALYPKRMHRDCDITFFGFALKGAGLNDVKNRNDLPLLTQAILHDTKVAWPPTTKEQGAIAEALSDVNGLLEGLDRLIAKKRDLTKAIKQQLLTGRSRLSGFNGEWELKALGELGFTYGGLTGKTKKDFGVGSSFYITFLNVIRNVVIDCDLFGRVQVAQTENQNRVVKGDLLFNGSSETPEEVAMCAVLAADIPNLFLNSFCFGYRLRDGAEANGLFLTYYLRSKEGRELIKSLAQGSTRYNLSKVELLKAALRLPSPNEQAAIAEVLTDMDLELTALEQRREKTRGLKEAMMQELLTGKTRLISATETHA